MKISLKRIIPVSFVFAGFFFWFLKMMRYPVLSGENVEYLGLFDGYTPFFYVIGGLFYLIFSCLRWNASPKWFRLVTPIAASLLTLILQWQMPHVLLHTAFAILAVTALCASCSLLAFEVVSSGTRVLDSLLSVYFCFIWLLLLYFVYQFIPWDTIRGLLLAALPLPLLLLPRFENSTDLSVKTQPITASFLRKPEFIRLLLLALASALINSETRTMMSADAGFAPLILDLIGISIILLSYAISVQTVMEQHYPKPVLLALVCLMGFAFYCISWTMLQVLPILPGVFYITLACVAYLGVALSYLIWPPRSNANQNHAPNISVFSEDVMSNYGLTKRETEVLNCLLQGKNVPMIMKELYISEGTVRTHINRIYRKINVHNKQELFERFALI
jgi:DNA-binding CsgD family transcriptional regulator